MAEYSGFFDAKEVTQPDGSKVWDRAYFAEHWADYFKLFIGNGVFVSPLNQLKIVAGTGMDVKMLPGWAFIDGYWYHNDSEKTITIPSNSTPSDVNCSINLILSETTERKIIQETWPSTDGLAKGEMRLAIIKVKPGASVIYNADITDTRPDENQCGFVKGLVDVIDTNDLFLQFTNMFNTWFDSMKGKLTTDAAGNLQTQMDAVKSAIGSDYIAGYTTPPSYAGGTITLYSGTRYVCADGKDANGGIKQTVLTLGANKTITLSGAGNYGIFVDNIGNLLSFRNETTMYVDKLSQLPSTVSDVYPFLAYVANEHRYYITSGSTTASWLNKLYCKVASARVVSSVITYFKPTHQQNLAQKVGKDKLLFTTKEINDNTDKEFVPSAVAVKSISQVTTSGWNPLNENEAFLWKTQTVSAPNFEVQTKDVLLGSYIDLSYYLSVGMKIRLVQGGVTKYFFIVKIAGNTITLYGGTDYTLTNAAISNVCYSMVEAPYGFPVGSNGLCIDFPIEIGSNANGNYEKWFSGKLVMWGRRETTSNSAGDVDLPYPASPVESANTSLTITAMPVNGHGDMVEIIGHVWLNPVNLTYIGWATASGAPTLKLNTICWFHWQFMGRWK